ncbi:MAPEG family protein [Cereibacter sphaeroides]|uniref:MAPEG family protein n=1 Tax=Cereibacter sphaeroides TaxID=1063 RepID=UPI001F2939D0|nr:MAPEG family protein [Cereibacter sphaeroides]MCE6958919.1 MAPEG family protein [Cereibacter sphaeroides]MCE6968850.1 MAPEG family protein [Cereibacter sphaeroides]MCE6973557.1 MAPEG family protein [Cereibacter sphaeroides]
MTAELTALCLAGLLQAATFLPFSVFANMELGANYTMSPRDRAPDLQLSTLTARLQRAMNNHFEGLILFTLAVLVVTLGNESTGFTATMAWVYLLARVLYVPAYALGWVPWRSAIWAVGFLATVAMLLAALI